MFYFGEINARGDTIKIDGVVGREDVNRAFQFGLRDQKDDDELDEFFEEISSNYEDSPWSLLGAIVDGGDHIKQAYEKFNNNQPFGVYSDEVVFGVGEELRDAKVAFAEIEFD